MIDSTNPRILANHIRKLWAKVNGIVPGTEVEGNPSGSGFNTLLTKIKIGSHKYKLPADVTANPEGEATGSLTKLGIGSGIYSVSSGSSGHTYSTTEQETNDKWLNNEVIYEKTIYNAGGTYGKIDVAHGITNFGRLISFEATAHDTYQSGADVPMAKIDDNGYNIGLCSVDATNLTYFVPSVYDARITDVYVTLRYTKITTP